MAIQLLTHNVVVALLVLVNAVPVIDHDGNISQVIVTFMDITDHKQAVDKLKESEATFKKLFDLSPLPISVTDMETGKIIDVNTKLCELTEHTRETLLGRHAMELGFYSAT